MKAERDAGKAAAALEALRKGALQNPPPKGEGGQPQAGGGASAAIDSPSGIAPPPRGFAARSPSPSQARGGSETNLLALCIECARARCTLGEMSAALEAAFGRHAVGVTPITGVYGPAHKDDAGWTRAVEGIAAVGSRMGRKPRILVAKMGQDGHDRGANVVASAFADMGFEVISGPLFQTPAEARDLALEKDVDVVGASSLAAGHKTLIPELIALLKEAGRADIKVVAGGVIPAQDYEFLRKAGVQAIFGPGTNLVEAAGEVLKLLGHNLPPIEEAAE